MNKELQNLVNEREQELNNLFAKIPEGSWLKEPHRVEFEHEGLNCLLNRNMMGAWCGYIGLPKGHPWHGKPYHKLNEIVSVHGGLTYSEFCGGLICHQTEGDDDLYWIGFDCAHFNDLVPSFLQNVIFQKSGDVYRELEYVRAETEKLAEQAEREDWKEEENE